MNDVERKFRCLDYLMNPDKVKEDVMEFVDVMMVCTNIMKDSENLEKMLVPDILDFVTYSKEYCDNIKPIAIKYGMLPHIMGEKGNDDQNR